ncbi:TonB system transport protein ExbD [Magnetospirillum sp. 15-1]|uniref:TonB system transport protein ExbD n=1 Tax=Magnetospirillum sp. 15-1 TaxID=1979370 RepID=UPI000BBC5658|nr:TonB system transport protein ExbD [Magnetospirillum sp. 15-1]
MAGGFEFGDGAGEMHEINVTPFIDVILVLLIIFMVAAPLATVDTDVDLPGSTAARRETPDKPVSLILAADRSLRVDGAPVTPEALGGTLDGLTGGNHETRIHLKADRSVDYGSMMAVLDRLRGAGYLKVALAGQEGGGHP